MQYFLLVNIVKMISLWIKQTFLECLFVYLLTQICLYFELVFDFEDIILFFLIHIEYQRHHELFTIQKEQAHHVGGFCEAQNI